MPGCALTWRDSLPRDADDETLLERWRFFLSSPTLMRHFEEQRTIKYESKGLFSVQSQACVVQNTKRLS